MRIATKSASAGRRNNDASHYGYGAAEEGRSNEEDEYGAYGAEEVEGKYHLLYEQRMNPFAEFSQHEKARKLQELSVADRIVLNTTMAIVSNTTGRT